MKRRTAKIVCMLSAAVLFAALLLGVAFASPAKAVDYTAEEIAFVQMLNEYRASYGLEPLLISDMISEACDRHSSDMAKYGFFDHYTVSSDWFQAGASPWDRMAASGYNFNTYKGENIAAGYFIASAVFSGWKASSGHNANMLKDKYRVIGVSAVYVKGSQYGCYWTTDFGGYVDSTAHSVAASASTTTTAAPTTTTTVAAPTTTTAAPTTTTRSSTTTTTRPPTTTTSTTTTSTTTTTAYIPRTTTTTTRRTTVTPTTAAAPTTTTTAPTTTTTSPEPLSPAFSDVNSETPYAGEIWMLADLGVISGYDNGSFGPDDQVTRQQFAKMVVLALGYQVSPLAASAFKDVVPLPDSPDPLYPAGYIAACAAAGITVGTTVDTFSPYGHITRAQLITMVARAAGLGEAPDSFETPFENFSATHYPWARRAAYAGLLDGLAGMGADYDFWGAATRGEVCLLLANLIGD